MAEWRVFGGWSSAELRPRLDALATLGHNFDAPEEQMIGERGWQHYHSEAVIARGGDDEQARFARAKTALATYQFSDPSIVVAHFDPDRPLHGRRLLLEIKIWGLHYLCPAVVSHVRDEADVFAFRYDTLAGHFERGVEWFLLTKEPNGDLRFRIEARWMRGAFPNWWSHLGFIAVGGFYQRRWHRRAHGRLSRLALYGSAKRPRRDAFGLTHQGVDVTFTYHTKRNTMDMTSGTLQRTIALAAVTGMRSMAGAATLAARQGGLLMPATALLAAGEMIADKTSFVGNRTDAVPQAGRAVMGAVVGGLVARQDGASIWVGALVGAVAAVAATHLAFQLRQRLPLSTKAGGLLEDALVIGAGMLYARATRRA